MIIPESAGALAIGRPVSELVDHRVLAGGMTIKAISNCVGSGFDFVIIALDIPDFYFNARSGQLWPVD